MEYVMFHRGGEMKELKKRIKALEDMVREVRDECGLNSGGGSQQHSSMQAWGSSMYLDYRNPANELCRFAKFICLDDRILDFNLLNTKLRMSR
jgi:hypothetical protein